MHVEPAQMSSLVTAILMSSAVWGAPCGGRLVEAREPVLLPLEAPQDVAVDPADGSVWISSGLSNRILKLDSDLREVGWVEAPFEEFGKEGVTGIAWHPVRETLLVVQPVLEQIWELSRDGTPTGLVVGLEQIPRPVNIIPRPFVKGIFFDPEGDRGRGSIWLVESVMTAVYEITLEGEILRSFCHPDDPDGCPGEGAAARSNGIGLLPVDGEPEAVEIVGKADGRERILHVDLDGESVGVEFPLEVIGGRVGGFCRTRWEEAGSGAERDVFLVTVESSAELHVLEIFEPGLLPIRDLSVEALSFSVQLSWKSFDAYERIELAREGELYATLPGTATAWTDGAPLEGVTRYEVAAVRGGCDSRLEGSVVFGPGQVLHSTLLDTNYPIDVTEDGEGNLWITDLENRVLIYDKDLRFITEFPGPFLEEGDELTGIAYNPDKDTVFLYNAALNDVAEIDMTGALAALPFPSGVTGPLDEEPVVLSMLFHPEGAAGEGSFLYLEYGTSTLQERTRTGELLGQCLHPDQGAQPPPAGAPFAAFSGGMTSGPDRSFSRLSLAGGRIRDGQITRILGLDFDSCQTMGEEVTASGIAPFTTPWLMGIHGTVHEMREVLYVVVPDYPQGHLLELDARRPSVPGLTALTCTQPTALHSVELLFSNPGGLEGIEVLRNGELVTGIDGDATSFVDRDVPAGEHTYALRPWKDGAAGDEVQCSLRVGPGSIALREFTFPASVLHQVALDPLTGGYVTASRVENEEGDLSRWDAELRFEEFLHSSFTRPLTVAALAVRAAGGTSEIHVLGWNPGAASGTQQTFPVRVLDREGEVLREYPVTPPRPRGRFVVFPSGMGWDSGSDSFWLLERNSATVMNFTPEGEMLRVFPHPARIHQDHVYNYGLAVDGERGVLYLSTAGPFDHTITRIVEVTRHGTVTGVEVPVGGFPYEDVWGFALNGESTSLVAFSMGSGVQDLVSYRAADPLVPMENVSCALEGNDAVLSWTNPTPYEWITIWRDGIEVATLAGTATEWTDAGDGGPGIYRLCGRRDGFTSASVICGPIFSRSFLRGDAEENGKTNISDAIVILEFLFLGGETPACLDAADVDDSGDLAITDGIALLGFLFLSGPPPEPPFPYAGLDFTPDDLECRG